MRTVVVRLSPPSGDGLLHGLVEVVGTGDSVPFVDDGDLLVLLHEANNDHHDRHDDRQAAGKRGNNTQRERGAPPWGPPEGPTGSQQ